jgi:PPOX class probable F420-dependent enzyme
MGLDEHHPTAVESSRCADAPLTLVVLDLFTESFDFDTKRVALMTTLDDAAQLGAKEQGLAVISTSRADGTIQSSLVNAGVMEHPLGEGPVVAFVSYGKVKLANLRARPEVTATFRSGWQWVAVEGHAQLIGPDDPHAAIDTERLRLLLREAFTAAGGSHDNWAEFDRVMAEQRRTLVLIEPTRIYGNQP